MSEFEIFMLVISIIGFVIGIIGGVHFVKRCIKTRDFSNETYATFLFLTSVLGIVGIVMSLTHGFVFSYPEEIEYMGRTYALVIETVEETVNLK